MKQAMIFLLTILLPLAAHPAGARVEVVVEGVSEAAQRNILEHLGIEQQKNVPDLSDGRIRRLHEKAPDEIRLALQPFGYYRPAIEAELTPTETGWRARYRVDPGPAVPIRELDLRLSGDGSGDDRFQALMQKFPIRQGDSLNHVVYEDSKRALQNLAAERGYLDARFTRQEVRVDLEAYATSIALHFDTGPRYRFGPVTIAQDILDPAFVARFVPFKPGDPYSTSALLELQSALGDSDYFANVEVLPHPEQAVDREVPIEVRLSPRKPTKYSLGVGYGTDTGARGSLGWERRYLNRDGHHMRADLQASQIKNSLTTAYIIPIRDPRTDYITFNAGMFEEDTKTAESEIRTFGVSKTRARGKWRETTSLNFHNEKFDIGGETGSSTLVLPGISWTRVRADDRIYAERGSRLTLEVRGGANSLGSDTSFVQSRAQAKYIHNLGAGRAIARVDAGASRVADFSELPASVRFFAGGDQSVRGYGYNTLGPVNDAGVVVGGRHLLVGSLEYEHRLAGKWSAAAFYDIGNAIDDFSDPLKKGAGIGLRWQTPIGQIRVDLAEALSEPGRPRRFHLVIGPDL